MKRKAFTLIELLVVIAIIALLLAILMPALKKAKNHAMTAVCLSNLKQLAFGWMMYADAYEGKIPASDIGYTPNGPYFWVQKSSPSDPVIDQEQALMDGVLWPYIENLKLYKCPTGKSEELRTYSMVGSMNSQSYGPTHWKGPIVKNLRKLRQPGSRIVFIDEGLMTTYAFMIMHKEAAWREQPPCRHNNGVTLSFADGHSERWKWEDTRTVELGKMERSEYESADKSSPGNPDLVKMQRAIWGELGYTPAP